MSTSVRGSVAKPVTVPTTPASPPTTTTTPTLLTTTAAPADKPKSDNFKAQNSRSDLPTFQANSAACPPPSGKADPSLLKDVNAARTGANARGSGVPANGTVAKTQPNLQSQGPATIDQKGNKAEPIDVKTPKYNTAGPTGPLDKTYGPAQWDNDESNDVKLRVSGAGKDPELRNQAYSAAHQTPDGTRTDSMATGKDGKSYRVTVSRNDPNVNVEVHPMNRASDGKSLPDMKAEMEAKGVKVDANFDKDELAQVYDGWAALKGPEQDALKGYTFKKGSGSHTAGGQQENAETQGKTITFFPSAFNEPNKLTGNMTMGAATLLHEVGHVMRNRNSSGAGEFDKTKGHDNPFTPYAEQAPDLAAKQKADKKRDKNEAIIDPKQERYAEAYMMYKSDPAFMKENYPAMYKFFEDGHHMKSAEQKPYRES